MPTRNINLTDRLDRFVAKNVRSGRFENASELVREALRLLEKQEREYEAKLKRLRLEVQKGISDVATGEFVTLGSDDEIDAFFEDKIKNLHKKTSK